MPIIWQKGLVDLYTPLTGESFSREYQFIMSPIEKDSTIPKVRDVLDLSLDLYDEKNLDRIRVSMTNECFRHNAAAKEVSKARLSTM